MFIGISNTTRRRILREALTDWLERDPFTQKPEDIEAARSMLREVNAAEHLGKPVAPGMSDPTHYGDR